MHARTVGRRRSSATSLTTKQLAAAAQLAQRRAAADELSLDSDVDAGSNSDSDSDSGTAGFKLEIVQESSAEEIESSDGDNEKQVRRRCAAPSNFMGKRKRAMVNLESEEESDV
eukprot:SAG31_NODE_2273_length_6037_cov_11.461862_5_plen_114_part_00